MRNLLCIVVALLVVLCGATSARAGPKLSSLATTLADYSIVAVEVAVTGELQNTAWLDELISARATARYPDNGEQISEAVRQWLPILLEQARQAQSLIKRTDGTHPVLLPADTPEVWAAIYAAALKE